MKTPMLSMFRETNFKETELGPLPEDWQLVKLGEVASIDWGNTSLTKALYKSWGYPAFSATGMDGYLDFFEQTGDAVIVSAIGARCGKCFLAQGNWTAIKNTIVIKPGNADTWFIYFYLDDEKKWPRSGSGQPFISLGKARLIPTPLPPLSEQKAIAYVLRTVQQAKEATEKVISSLKNLKKSLMRHLFTYGPVPLDKIDSVPLRETELGPLPAHWKVVRLGELVEKPQYGYTAIASDHPVGPRFLRITDIQNGNVVWTSVPFCKINQSEIEKYNLRAGDILIARIGATTGKTFIVKECPPAIFASYLIRIRVLSDKTLLPEYLFFLTDSLLYWMQINMNKGGRLKQGINIPIIQSLLIPLPPFPEQQEIARILRLVDQRIEAEEAYKKALDELFRTLLHILMSGKIRVKIINSEELK